jgi:ABC-2 type transport system permease protein
MSLASEVAILARVHWRTFRAKASHTARHSRLLSATIGLFLVGYLVVGYLLFCQGLRYLTGLPGVGYMLTTRVIYMTYFFFLLMLVFSNAVLLYSGLFRGRETPWLLTTPISPRAVFLWKIIESFIVSSWGLAILSAPLLASVGKVFGADGWFYVKCALVYPLLLLLPAAVAGLLVATLVRWWGKSLRVVMWVVIAFVGWRVVSGLVGPSDLAELARTTDLTKGFKKVLGFTEVTMNRFLPSAWMSEMLLYWSHGYESRGMFYGLVLLSWALMLGWICTSVASRATYPAWNLSQQRRARRTGRRRRPFAVAVSETFRFGWLNRIPLLRRDTVALIRKDLKEFTRDPAQWIPCAIVFTLLLLYASNLNRAADADPGKPHFRLVLSSLNFGVCSLTLSTLTTRFIFPMFSLEGRRLWVLGLSPVGMHRVFRQKLMLYSAIIGMATGGLMLLSGLKLGMSAPDVAFYCGAIVLMSTGLTALALSLGVLFPNFHDASPAKIVSGFGGTLCLILNFIFILLFMGLFVWHGTFSEIHKGEEWAPARLERMLLSSGLLILLTVIFTGIPIQLSLRKMKRVETLGTI